MFDRDRLTRQVQAGQEYQLGGGGAQGLVRRVATPPTFGLDLVTPRCLERLGRALGGSGSLRPVLNVGSGARLNESMRRLGSDVLSRTIHVDVSPRFDLVDLVADADRSWPIRSGSVDAVIASAMLHHLREPHTFSEQVHRVLAPGGWLFVTAPMLQPQMEDFDCTRWTLEGLRRLFAGLEVVELGPTAGPATVFGRVLMEFLAVVTSLPDHRLWGPARSLWGWLFWPIKHLDLLLLRHPRSHVLASAVYMLARKPT